MPNSHPVLVSECLFAHFAVVMHWQLELNFVLFLFCSNDAMFFPVSMHQLFSQPDSDPFLKILGKKVFFYSEQIVLIFNLYIYCAYTKNSLRPRYSYLMPSHISNKNQILPHHCCSCHLLPASQFTPIKHELWLPFMKHHLPHDKLNITSRAKD